MRICLFGFAFFFSLLMTPAFWRPQVLLSQDKTTGKNTEEDKSRRFTLEKNAPDSLRQYPLRIVNNGAFKVGEKLVYNIRYNAIDAGTGELWVREIIEVNGKPCYYITSLAESNDFFSLFYRVRDTVETYVDVKGLFPWQFEKHLHEGNYHKDDFIQFDPYQNRAITQDDTIQVPPFVQDILSAMYFVRTQDFSVGDTLYIDSYGNGKIYPLKIIVHRREPIRSLVGEFNCLLVEPVLKTPALFKQKGRVAVWVTDDHRKIPILVKSQIYAGKFKLGEVVVELVKMEGIN